MSMNQYPKWNKENFQSRNYQNNPQRQPSHSSQSQKQQGQNALREAIGIISKLKNMSDLDPKAFVDTEGIAAKVAEQMVNAKERDRIKTAQLRKFFDQLVKIEGDLDKKSWDELEGRLYMVLPILAYSVGRNLAPREFYNLIDICIKKVVVQDASVDEKRNNFKRFMDFLRSIVAYVKYYSYGGGD